MLKHLFSKKALPSQLSYEEARAVLEKREGKLQQELATHPDAEPEMLYYIAEHGTPEARQAVAANLATPAAANLLLTGDGNTDVRVELARKVGRLLPDLAAAEKDKPTNRPSKHWNDWRPTKLFEFALFLRKKSRI